MTLAKENVGTRQRFAGVNSAPALSIILSKASGWNAALVTLLSKEYK